MTDVLTKKQRSYNMSRIKYKNTKPELLFRKYIFSKGLRGYRLHSKLPGKPDIVFSKYKVAVFIDGCFWHRCSKCFKMPKDNREFWEKKINRNVKRDKEVNLILKKEGWVVLRIWEHLLRKDINMPYEKIITELKKRGY